MAKISEHKTDKTFSLIKHIFSTDRKNIGYVHKLYVSYIPVQRTEFNRPQCVHRTEEIIP